ncbi:MAG: hypothetical protein FJ164_03620 [Gammaproteobacteria bacterium]|nr:hypothetical protein [Gammaproteobacteria bacterium]
MRSMLILLSLLSSQTLFAEGPHSGPAGQNGPVEQAGNSARTELKPEAFIGTWSLSDEQNDVFDVVLGADGSARSNWVKGARGAEGEGGRWKLYGQGVRIDYDDGWTDIIRVAATGFQQVSYSPETPLTGPWSNHGKAVRLEGPSAEWVGVYHMNSATKGKAFSVALQSDGQAFKTIGEDRRGLWSLMEGALQIHWIDGWYDELHRSANGRLEQRSWKPGQARSETPSASAEATRL